MLLSFLGWYLPFRVLKLFVKNVVYKFLRGYMKGLLKSFDEHLPIF